MKIISSDKTLKKRKIDEVVKYFNELMALRFHLSEKTINALWSEYVAKQRAAYNLKEGESLSTPFFNNANLLSKAYPSTFQAPSKEDLEKITEGTNVKINLNDLERVWVEVENVNHKSEIVKGKINNDTVFSIVHGLDYEDKVVFKFAQIYQIHEE